MLAPRASISALSLRFDWALHAIQRIETDRPMALQVPLDVASNSSDRAGVARQCFKAASQSNTSPLKCHPARWRRETGDGLPPCHGLFSHCPSPSFFSFLPGFSASCLAPSRNLGPNVMNLIWTGLSPFPFSPCPIARPLHGICSRVSHRSVLASMCSPLPGPTPDFPFPTRADFSGISPTLPDS